MDAIETDLAGMVEVTHFSLAERDRYYGKIMDAMFTLGLRVTFKACEVKRDGDSFVTVSGSPLLVQDVEYSTYAEACADLNRMGDTGRWRMTEDGPEWTRSPGPLGPVCFLCRDEGFIRVFGSHTDGQCPACPKDDDLARMLEVRRDALTRLETL